jgi:hypothetical protein
MMRFFGFGRGSDKIPVEEGLNTFTWNLRLKSPEVPKGVVHWGGMRGPAAVPGNYKVRLSAGDWSETRQFKVEPNPNYPTTVAQYQEQLNFVSEVGAKIEELFDGLTKLRDVKTQAKGIVERLKKAGIEDEDVAKAAKELNKKLTEIEEKLTQVKSKSRQDPINFPPQIDNQFTTLYSYVSGNDYQPTAGARQRFEDLKPELAELMGQLNQILDTDVASFNTMVSSKNVPPVVIAK